MKKLFCIMLALAFLALAACGVSETPVGTPEAAPTATAQPPEESPEEPSEAPWPPSEIDAAETVLELAVEWVSEEDMTGEELMPAYTDAVDAEGRAQSLPFMEHLGSESVAGLSANGSELYVEEGGRYWTFDLENPDAAPESSEAYRLADGTLWEPHFAGNGILTHTMTLDVTHPDGKTLSIPFEASGEGRDMAGLRLIRCGGGQYDVYAVEISQDEEYRIWTTEYILRVDETGAVLGVYSGSESADLHNTRADSGALYYMSVTDNAVTVTRLPDVYTQPMQPETE